MKAEATSNYRDILGLHSSNTQANFYKAVRDFIMNDLKWRASRDQYKLPNGELDERILGIVRHILVDYDAMDDNRKQNKEITPFKIQLHDIHATLLFNECARDGRVVINYDGTGSQVPWGCFLPPNTCCQCWKAMMLATFMAPCPETNSLVRRHVLAYCLFEYHSTMTTGKDLADSLSRFFNTQTRLGLEFRRPLAFLTDCASPILTAVMTALAFPDTVPVTKTVYNNILSAIVVCCEM